MWGQTGRITNRATQMYSDILDDHCSVPRDENKRYKIYVRPVCCVLPRNSLQWTSIDYSDLLLNVSFLAALEDLGDLERRIGLLITKDPFPVLNRISFLVTGDCFMRSSLALMNGLTRAWRDKCNVTLYWMQNCGRGDEILEVILNNVGA